MTDLEILSKIDLDALTPESAEAVARMKAAAAWAALVAQCAATGLE